MWEVCVFLFVDFPLSSTIVILVKPVLLEFCLIVFVCFLLLCFSLCRNLAFVNLIILEAS